MNTDKQLYTLLGSDPEILAILTDGIRIRGTYHFDAIEVKGLNRRSDGVLLPDDPIEPIWVIEFQAQSDINIYHRTIVEMGLIGERYTGRTIYGLILFATPNLDPQTEPWAKLSTRPDAPLRVTYLSTILDRLEMQNPEHPLLAAFLPYRCDDNERLHAEGARAWTSIENSELPVVAKKCLLDVFCSWLMLRFDKSTYQEIVHMFGNVTKLEQTQAYQDIIAIGRLEGERKGKLEGKAEGEATLLQRQIIRRFGVVPIWAKQRLENASTEQIESWAEAIFDAKDIEQLLNS